MTTSEVFLTKLPHVPLESYKHPEDDAAEYHERECDEYTVNGDDSNKNGVEAEGKENEAREEASKQSSDLQAWLRGNSFDSDDYDTDLEDDFPPGEFKITKTSLLQII